MIRESFLKSGYIEANNNNEADICVVNTCTVTSTSDSKSLKSIRSSLKKKDKCVVATGCMIEANSLNLYKLKGVDFIIKNRDKFRIPQLIMRGSNTAIIHSQNKIHEGYGQVSITHFEGHARAFVKVQDGCDNRCSYCKVSVVRGRSRSRPLEEVFLECKILLENGYKEIVLTGICLGAYGRDISSSVDLSKLIKELCKIKGD